MTEFNFYYSDGSQLRKYDKVLVNQTRIAWIEDILMPETTKAREYSCPEGGFIVIFEDGDVQVWPDTDEDICLIERGQDNSTAGKPQV